MALLTDLISAQARLLARFLDRIHQIIQGPVSGNMQPGDPIATSNNRLDALSFELVRPGEALLALFDIVARLDRSADVRIAAVNIARARTNRPKIIGAMPLDRAKTFVKPSGIGI